MEEAGRLEMSIVIHIANGNAANVKLYGLVPGTHRASGFGIFRVPTVTACMFLILSEISTLFPKLRWGFIEASAQWIPWITAKPRGASRPPARNCPTACSRPTIFT
jgi:hypothetical protein